MEERATKPGPEAVSNLPEPVNIASVCAALQEVGKELGVQIRNGQDLVSTSGALLALIGLRSEKYCAITANIDPRISAAILAVTCEKSLRDSDLINNPVGYFVACFERFRSGDLRLMVLVRGLLNDSLKRATSHPTEVSGCEVAQKRPTVGKAPPQTSLECDAGRQSGGPSNEKTSFETGPITSFSQFDFSRIGEAVNGAGRRDQRRERIDRSSADSGNSGGRDRGGPF